MAHFGSNNKITIDLFNRTVAEILKENRARTRKSLKDVSKSLKHSSQKELSDFESGAVSPRGYQFYEILKQYENTITMDEIMFFSCNSRVYDKCLSKSFQSHYFGFNLAVR